jgi:hypothetical protein
MGTAQAEPPATPLPTIAVSPSSGLVHNQTVTVTGRGFPPESAVFLVECLATEVGGCDFATETYVATDITGAFTTEFRVRRVIGMDSAQGRGIDCAATPETCEIRNSSYEASERASAALDFDSRVPLPPRPTLQASPTTGLVNRQSVSLSGTGYPPNEEIQVAVCPPSTLDVPPFPPFTFPCMFVGFATTDTLGSFTLTVKVVRVMPGSDGPDVDCATTACVLRAASYLDALGSVDLPIEFDASVPAPPPLPELTVTPTIGLDDGQLVTVTGIGFSPSAPVDLAECRTPLFSEQDCDASSYDTVTTDGNGGFRAELAVRRVVTIAGETLDCGAVANRCAIAANPDEFFQFGEYTIAPGLEFAVPSVPVVGPELPSPPDERVEAFSIGTRVPAGDTRVLARTGADVVAYGIATVMLLSAGLVTLAVGRFQRRHEFGAESADIRASDRETDW